MMKMFVAGLGIGLMMLSACAFDGRGPRVGVGVAVGNPMPPPVVVAPGPPAGPPPWAPAHGVRSRYRYYYYPASGVYFNVSTGSYFYLNGDSWQVAMSLPSTVFIDSGNYVTLDLDTDRPYLFYDEHRGKYKSYGRGNGRGHGRGYWKDRD